MPFNFKTCELSGLILAETKSFSDERGSFMEYYKSSDFGQQGLPAFVQDNFSNSHKGVLRGLHYQLAPHAQGKLVRAVSGKIWDVAVDIRPSSPTFKRWLGFELSEENGLALYVPVGFAHGFVALADNTRVLYKTTAEYHPELEQGIRWGDPELKINWPIANPIVSPRDQNLPTFDKAKLEEVK